MFTLSKFEWLVLALALALCPGWSWGAEPVDRDGISRAEFGLGSKQPKKE